MNTACVSAALERDNAITSHNVIALTTFARNDEYSGMI